MKKKIILLLFIFSGIFYLRYLSFTAYNIRPVKECSKFLEKTYGREFKRTKKAVEYYLDDYHVWKIQYVDDTGMEFYEYYKQPSETSWDGYIPYCVSDERYVCDYYWQQQIQRVYGETFDLEKHLWSEPSTVKYEFEITDESDIEETANIIAVLLRYTFDNVKTISDDVLGYTITYDGWPIYTIYEDMEGLLELRTQDEEDINQYVYNKIYKYYQREIERRGGQAKNIGEYPAKESVMQEAGSERESEVEKTYPDEWEIEHIEALSMSYSDGVTQDDINRIGQCRNLKKLEIYIWDDGLDLSPLSNLTKLETIGLSAHSMDKMDVSFLADLTGLKELSLYGSEIEDYSFFHSLWQLRDVWMLGNTTIEDLSFFSDMYNLKSLYIDGVQDADLSCLANLENIEKICIAGHQIRNVEALANLFRVKELGFYEYGVYGEERLTFDLHCLDNMAKLESLSLMYVNVEDITPLADKQILETVRLVDTGVEDIEPLKNLDNLQRLEIYANKSEKVKEQAELYFNGVEHVNVSREILNDKL